MFAAPATVLESGRLFPHGSVQLGAAVLSSQKLTILHQPSAQVNPVEQLPSDIQRTVVKEDGQKYEFYIEAPEGVEESRYRDINLPTVDMKKVHSTIRGYARYAIGAFVNFGLAEVEEMNLEFNLKISGKAGLPMLTEASVEDSFKIQVKCKFPE